jgi:hypothetical protein
MKKSLLTLLFAGQALFIWSQTVVNLSIGQPAILEASAGNDVTISKGNSTALQGSATGGTPAYTYKWAPTTGLNSPTSAAPTANPADTTTYTLTVSDKNKCTAMTEVTVNVTKASSLAGAQTNGLIIYPNPVGKTFFIRLETPALTTTISLYSIDGRQVWQKSLASSELSATAFETPDAPGMYLLKVTSGSQSITETLVVSKNTK